MISVSRCDWLRTGARGGGSEAQPVGIATAASAAASEPARKRQRLAAQAPAAALPLAPRLKAAGSTAGAGAEFGIDQRRPTRYEHITVEMLSESGFLDMPIQVGTYSR